MKIPSAILLAVIVSLSACNSKLSSGDELKGEGITFLVPSETSSSSAGTGGISYSSKSVEAETDGKTLKVNGAGYGSLAAGDIVDLRNPGKVIVNGAERLTLGQQERSPQESK